MGFFFINKRHHGFSSRCIKPSTILPPTTSSILLTGSLPGSTSRSKGHKMNQSINNQACFQATAATEDAWVEMSSIRRHPSATLSNSPGPSSRDTFHLQASRLQTLQNPERAWTTCHQVLHAHHVDVSKQSERNVYTPIREEYARTRWFSRRCLSAFGRTNSDSACRVRLRWSHQPSRQASRTTCANRLPRHNDRREE